MVIDVCKSNKIERNMQRVKASQTQLKYLIDYMKENKEKLSIELYNNSGTEGKIRIEKEWRRLTEILNNLGGPVKSVGKWKQAWRDIRCNFKKKVMQNKAEVTPENQFILSRSSTSKNPVNENRRKIISDVDTHLSTPAKEKQNKKFSSAESGKNNGLEIKDKPKVVFQKLVKAKMDISFLRKQLIIEELEEKKLRKQMLKDEIEYKRELCELEKKEKFLKIEILKIELENKRKFITIL